MATEDRFFRFVQPEPNSGCWLWTGAVYRTGYGSFMLPTEKGWRSHYAHRLAWEWTHGPIPRGMYICHRCDTPACVNPDHLFLGTPRDNAHDAMRKGRHIRGERQGRAKLTEAQVREIIVADGPAVKVAARYGVSRGAIEGIRYGKNWRHVAAEKVL